jgi:hypothetical protein
MNNLNDSDISHPIEGFGVKCRKGKYRIGKYRKEKQKKVEKQNVEKENSAIKNIE